MKRVRSPYTVTYPLFIIFGLLFFAIITWFVGQEAVILALIPVTISALLLLASWQLMKRKIDVNSLEIKKAEFFFYILAFIVLLAVMPFLSRVIFYFEASIAAFALGVMIFAPVNLRMGIRYVEREKGEQMRKRLFGESK